LNIKIYLVIFLEF